MKPLQVYIDTDMLKQLKQIALDDDISVSEVVREYLRQSISSEDGVVVVSGESAIEEIKSEPGVKEYPNKFCKHGSPIGLCRFNCKK